MDSCGDLSGASRQVMAERQQLLDSLAGLFEYPSWDFSERVTSCRALADQRSPGRGDAIAALEERTKGMGRGEVEEMFTRTFEINPVCALEVGWHIYGEDYARGALLVRLRQELREQGIPEIAELPDHLTHVLQLLGRLGSSLADDLAGRYVLPALKKMIEDGSLEEYSLKYFPFAIHPEKWGGLPQ